MCDKASIREPEPIKERPEHGSKKLYEDEPNDKGNRAPGDER